MGGAQQNTTCISPSAEELKELTGLLSSQNGAQGCVEPTHLAFLTPWVSTASVVAGHKRRWAFGLFDPGTGSAHHQDFTEGTKYRNSQSPVLENSLGKARGTPKRLWQQGGPSATGPPIKLPIPFYK